VLLAVVLKSVSDAAGDKGAEFVVDQGASLKVWRLLLLMLRVFPGPWPD
jgi:hypothetical protein